MKYILREYLKILSLCLAALVLVYLAIDVFGRIGRLIQEDASFSMILLYFGLKIPKMLFDVAPIGMLVATLIALGLQSRHNEIVAMKSAGIRLLYATSPILISAFALSLTLGACSLSLIPLSQQKAGFVRAVKIKKSEEQAYYGQSRLWLRDGRRTFINVRFVDSIHSRLHEVILYRLRDDFTLKESIEAKEVRYENGTWMMDQGRIRTFSSDGGMTERTFKEEPVLLERTPKEFKGLDVDTEKMKFAELKRYIDRLAKDGYDVKRFRVDLYNKISLPFVSFIMSLLAIPFGLVETRTRGIARGIGIALLIGGCYWIVHSVALSLGHAGLLPPLLSSGLANLLFLTVGIYLYLGIRQ